MSKLTVITGSPRKNGNSFALTDAFVEAAKKKGCKIRCGFYECLRMPCVRHML